MATNETATWDEIVEAHTGFNLTLTRAGLSQVGAAELFGVEARTVRRWVSGSTPVPVAVRIVLGLLGRHWITLDDVEYFAGRISIEELNARNAVRAAQRHLDEIRYAELRAKITAANEAKYGRAHDSQVEKDGEGGCDASAAGLKTS